MAFKPSTKSDLQALKAELKASAPSSNGSSKTNMPAPPSATQTPALDPAEEFRAALGGVTPLAQSPPPDRPKRTALTAQTLARRAAAQGHDGVEVAGLSDTQALLNPVASEATLSYRIGTLPHRVFDALKAGKLRWLEAVDLHGCTIEEARQAVLALIHIAQAEQHNVIKIVHGKGPQATLKSCVNGWLRQHPQVLAFVSAPPEQGGTGAVLVLLKKPNEGSSLEHAPKR